MTQEAIGIGVIGCGSFGRMALQQFTQDPGIRLVGIAGTDSAGAEAAADRFRIPDFGKPKNLLDRSEVELVYIATPPFLHHAQALQALRAGKHVICEKPFALTLEQADEMIETARSRDLLVVANLMQRYNPLYEAVKGLIERDVLGNPLHAIFENYASDEGLGPDHWFWDHDKSGGIFVEHSVHFFDMFAGWFGDGEVAAAQRSLRPGWGLEEQVQCTLRYGETVLVNLYHGFHQPYRMDRQELRIVFERGDVRLFEWVPTRAQIHAVVDEEQTRRLTELFPGCRIDVTEWYPPDYRSCAGRHKDIDAYQMIELSQGEGREKWHVYGDLLRRLIHDQVAWIRNPEHRRVITAENGRASLTTALEADRLARKG